MARLCLSFLIIFTSLLLAQDHLLITEFVVTPTDGEFIEIHNPTSNTVNLSNFYLTDATFTGGNQFYYNIVTGSNAGGGSSNDFHARFPDGAVINPGEFKVIAMNGTGFVNEYGTQPNYELYETDGNIVNMREAFAGSIAGNSTLSNSGEVVILYSWDGNSDLVQDIDYVVWGDKAEAIDKTGVSIDGPDSGSDPSTYLDDTSIQNQISVSSADPHSGGESAQRLNLVENGETLSGGNGITGHDETSEDLATSFPVGTPNPGTGPGGSMAPSISNVAHSPANPTSSDMVTVSADVIDDGIVVEIKLFFSLSGAPSDSTDMILVSGNTYQATIDPQPDGTTVEYFIKATDDEGLTSTSSTFSYTVGGPQITPIADIQANPSAYTSVTIEGIVTLGTGITITSRTDAYVQDTSGRGINIFSFDPPDPLLVRGNKVRITGTVEEFQGVTEITDYTIQLISTGNPIPDPLELTTQQANNIALEGTYIKVTGNITSIEVFSDATNITVDDGSGDVLIRVWGTTGIDLSDLAVNDLVTIQAVMDVFQSSSQLIPGYQDEIVELITQPGDGSGTASIDPDSVGKSQSVTETITVQGESSYTLESISVTIPYNWQWTGGVGNVQISGSGFSNASVNVQGSIITISSAAVTNFDPGTIEISGLISPASDTLSSFLAKTAEAGGILTPIASSPMVTVGTGVPIIPIANIQDSVTVYQGQQVTIQGVVTLGAGKTITTRTDAYIQDNSGRGINIFSFDPPNQPPNDLLVRGNELRITGTVTEFSGVTEITDYTIDLISSVNPMPDPLESTTQQANNIDLEGTYIQVIGIIQNIEDFGDATNITLNDGTGNALIRVWATTGINLSYLSLGDSLSVQAVMDVFENAAQLIPGYQDEVLRPGTLPGDGTGIATIQPDSVGYSEDVVLTITITGEAPYTLETVSFSIYGGWDWTGGAGNVQISGNGFSGANVDISGSVITISSAAVTDMNQGIIRISGLTSPGYNSNSTFLVSTSVAGGKLTRILNNPVVTVGEGIQAGIFPIAEIQNNVSVYENQDVTIEGIVTLGAGITVIERTDFYVQDSSGRGINVFSFDIPDTTLFVRGNKVRITGTVEEFGGITEITDFTATLTSTANPIPMPLELTTFEARNRNLEGTYIQINGTITSIDPDEDAVNLEINDGSGDVAVRVWGTTQINMLDFGINDNVIIHAVMDLFENSAQLIPGYRDEFIFSEAQPGDGAGTASIAPGSVSLSTDVTERITIKGEVPFTLKTITIQLPGDWKWSGGKENVSLSGTGFSSASAVINGLMISINSAAITAGDSGVIEISGLTSADRNTTSIFIVRTAVANGKLFSILNYPQVKVGQGGTPVAITRIEDIQDNISIYEGKQVTLDGIVTLGAGVITGNDRTDAYIQDRSGRGINLFSFDPPDPSIERGNRLQVSGFIEEFGSVTELTNFNVELISTGNPFVEPLFVSSDRANDITLEGTYLKVAGITEEIENFDDAVNLTLRDERGTVLVRVWRTSGINLGFVNEGDTVAVQAVMDVFNNNSQLIPGYQDEIIVPGETTRADGSGFAFTSHSTVDSDSTFQDFSVFIAGIIKEPIHTVRIDLPKFWQWSDTNDISLEGASLVNAFPEIKIEEIDSVFQIFLNNTSIAKEDTAKITFHNIQTPAEPLNSVFWIRTAGENGKLRLIDNVPKVQVANGNRYLIYDLQVNSREFVGQITMQGVTTIGSGLLREFSSTGDSLTTAYIQDESGRGINLFRFGLIDPKLVRGNLVEVTGVVTEFEGTTEIEYTDISVLLEDVELSKPIKLNNAQVNTTRWDGTLIASEGVILDKFSAGGGTTMQIGDGEGTTSIRIWDTAELDLSDFSENTRIFVEGVGNLFLSDGDSIFQILSVYQDQITLDPNYSPSLDNVKLQVEPHPFAPDRGEKIKITYNAGAVNNQVTIRIFDLGGRLVTTLLSEQAQLIENTFKWDGRNQLRDFVPLGAYICHIEVIEPVTGKKKTKTAPIVVGTILSR